MHVGWQPRKQRELQRRGSWYRHVGVGVGVAPRVDERSNGGRRRHTCAVDDVVTGAGKTEVRAGGCVVTCDVSFGGESG